MNEWFSKASSRVTDFAGSPAATITSVLVILAWAAYGMAYGFTDTVQLFINTGTTIVTFVMVFLIQSTQNKDSRAVHLKLDELIRVNKDASNRLVALETRTQKELEEVSKEVREDG